MWIFAKQGLLMPSTFPRDKVPAEYLKPEYDLQVRGRVREHLERWAEAYMAPGTYSDIQATPGMDYNFRFYCSHDDFAWAMGKSIADIDYAKFKPAAERPEYGNIGKDYHVVLNSIWSTVCRLGSPGGWWGEYDPVTNPGGYRPGQYSSRYSSSYKSVGSSSRSSDRKDASIAFSDWEDEDFGYSKDLAEKYDPADMDYTPSAEEEADFVIDDLRRSQIPTNEWQDSCTENEWIAIKPYFKREVRREKREARKARKAKHTKAA